MRRRLSPPDVIETTVRSTPERPPDELTPPEAQSQAAPASAGKKPIPYGRAYLILTLVYLVIVVYGSLVPLRLRHIPFDQGVEQFKRIPWLHLSIRSRADLVANMLLFIPLTFLAMGALTREGRRRGRAVIAAAVVAAGCGLSVAIEFTQVFFGHRTVSQNDIVAEMTGGLVGVVLWFICGRGVTRWGRSVWHDRTGDRVAARILAGYCVFVIIYLLVPFDLTISLKEICQKFQSAKVTVIPFTNLGQTWLYTALSTAALMVPVGYLLYMLGRRHHGGGLVTVALAGMALSAILELGQVFTFSRYASTTDVIYGTLGALGGGVAGMFFGPAARWAAIRSRFWARWGTGIKLAALSAWIGGAVWQKWRPFNFARPRGGLGHAVRGIFVVPFTRQYGLSEFAAGVQVVREFTMAFVMAMLLRGLLAPATRAGRLGCTLLAVAIAANFEVVQVFLPSRTADLTAIIIAGTAAVLGVRAMPGFVNVFLRAGTAVPGADEPGASSQPRPLPS